MYLSSPAFENQGQLDQRFGKRDANISPPLEWGDLPPGTQSLALSIVDHHPVANEYVHWLVADIPPDAAALAEGAAATGLPAHAKELEPYAGPFPPAGTHDYEFTFYALDVPALDSRGRSLARFLQAVKPHTLATATLVGSFTRMS